MSNRKTVLLAFVVLSALAYSVLWEGDFSSDQKIVSSLVLENIEALASNESEDRLFFCYGIGDVACPDGTKAEYVAENYSLSEEDE